MNQSDTTQIYQLAPEEEADYKRARQYIRQTGDLKADISDESFAFQASYVVNTLQIIARSKDLFDIVALVPTSMAIWTKKYKQLWNKTATDKDLDPEIEKYRDLCAAIRQKARNEQPWDEAILKAIAQHYGLNENTFER